MTKQYDPRIAEARRVARSIARDQGTPYQTALEDVARRAGATNWTAFVESPVDVSATRPDEEPPHPREKTSTQKTGRVGMTFTPGEADLLRRMCVGVLCTVLTVTLGTGLLFASTVLATPWSAIVETCGTASCAAGVLAAPGGMSGYVLGVRVHDTGHAMSVRWRIVMAFVQGCFILGVAHHLLAAS